MVNLKLEEIIRFIRNTDDQERKSQFYRSCKFNPVPSLELDLFSTEERVQIADAFADKKNVLEAAEIYAQLAEEVKDIRESCTYLTTAFNLAESFCSQTLQKYNGDKTKARNDLFLVNPIKIKFANSIKDGHPEKYKEIMLSVAEAYAIRHDIPCKTQGEEIYVALGEYEKALEIWLGKDFFDETEKNQPAPFDMNYIPSVLEREGDCMADDFVPYIRAWKLLKLGNFVEKADLIKKKVSTRLNAALDNGERSIDYLQKTYTDNAAIRELFVKIYDKKPTKIDSKKLHELKFHQMMNYEGHLRELYEMYGQTIQLSSGFAETDKLAQKQKQVYVRIVELLRSYGPERVAERPTVPPDPIIQIVAEKDKNAALELYEKFSYPGKYITGGYNPMKKLAEELLASTPAENTAEREKLEKKIVRIEMGVV